MTAPASVVLKPVTYKGWSAWSVRRDPLELILVPQVGGRIMGMKWRGRELYFTQPEREGQTLDVSALGDLHAAKKAMGFPLWGGDKTWLAPQTRWSDAVPFLDLDSGPYDCSIIESGPERVVAKMISPICRETGVQITRTLAVSADTHDWRVTHELHNTTDHEVEWAVWDVSMVLKPATIYLPTHPRSRYDGGVKTFSEEGESLTVRNRVVGTLGHLAVIQCRDHHAFKFGVDAHEGWMLAVLDVGGLGPVGYLKHVPVDQNGTYGHGCVAETYNSDRYPYCEMEIHGPVVKLKPGTRITLTEQQALFDVPNWPTHEAEIRQYIAQHISLA